MRDRLGQVTLQELVDQADVGACVTYLTQHVLVIVHGLSDIHGIRAQDLGGKLRHVADALGTLTHVVGALGIGEVHAREVGSNRPDQAIEARPHHNLWESMLGIALLPGNVLCVGHCLLKQPGHPL